MKPRLLFIVGASGAGKTTAVRNLDSRRLSGVKCYYFDTIGVPSVEVMERDWGSGERWQEDATRRWIERLVANADGAAVAVLDGQTRPSFIRTYAVSAGATYRVVLLDCHAAVRATRLRGRAQPELATDRMEQWASFLRREATEHQVLILDTSRLSAAAVADALQRTVEEFDNQERR